MSLRDEIANVIKNWYGYKDIDLCAADILSLPAMQSLVKNAERIRKANEYLEGIEGIEINDVNGMVAVFNALSIIIRTAEGG